MRAFFPASGKVDLVEAAEAHAWRLDQLAHNLSRCGAREGATQDAAQVPAGQFRLRGSSLLGGRSRREKPSSPRGQAGRAGSRDGGRPACQEGATQALLTQPGASPLPHSIIRDVNQDRFIQRAIEAANAYGSILRAVQAAEGAAGQALQQASHAWAVRPWRSPRPLRGPLPPRLPSVGANAVLSPCLQTVVQQGLGPRARELRANSSGLGDAALREQRRLDRGECRLCPRVQALRGPLGSGQCAGICGGYGTSGR